MHPGLPQHVVEMGSCVLDVHSERLHIEGYFGNASIVTEPE
jgi:hypothetical protein